MKQTVARFLADETGATAIEYGLIASGIALAIIVALNNVGTQLNAVFVNIKTKLATAASAK
jgi:pilus assembly protein Flp/PilA